MNYLRLLVICSGLFFSSGSSETRGSSEISPEFKKAANVFKAMLYEHIIGKQPLSTNPISDYSYLQTDQKYISSSYYNFLDFPLPKNWKWNQSRSGENFTVYSNSLDLEVKKYNLINKDRTKKATKPPKLKMWIGQYQDDKCQLTLLWMEKGLPQEHELIKSIESRPITPQLPPIQATEFWESETERLLFGE